MKISFRLTLISILLLMVGTTVLVIGGIFYRQAHSTADDLARQLLDQTAARVDSQISSLLNEATLLNAATEARLRTGRLRSDDPGEVVSYLRDALVTCGEVSGYFIGMEQSGEATGMTRVSGRPIVWQSSLKSDGSGYQTHEYLLEDYPKLPLSGRGGDGPDIRKRPWYEQVRAAGRPVWTESFVFLGAEGVQDVHGVTYASPVRRDGKLVAVLDADFDLQQISRFLRSIGLGRGGIAFVIERRDDGSRKVVAHPTASLLSPAIAGAERSLLAPEEFPDPRVAAFGDVDATPGHEGRRPQDTIRLIVGGEPYLGTIRQLSGANSPAWTICVVLPEEEVLGRVHRSLQQTLLIGLAVLVAAVLVSLYLSTQVSKPLEGIEREAIAVGNLQVSRKPAIRSIVKEVDRLGMAMEDMKAGLRSFRKFVPPDVVRAFLSSNSEATFGGMRRNVTIFFSDIVDFTTIAQDLSPEELVELLREYLNALTAEIEAGGGTVDKYIGDAIMAFWGAPLDDPGHASAACLTAIRCQAVLKTLNESWEAAGRAPFRTRIGLHTGEVIVGNIGSDTRLNYTIIGDAVNLASRLEGLNKHYGTSILISDSTEQQARREIVTRPIDFVAVKGRRDPVLISEVIGLRSAEPGSVENDELREVFAKILDLYQKAEFAAATSLLQEVLRVRPDDPPARVLLDRCHYYAENPPGEGWDGVYRRDQK